MGVRSIYSSELGGCLVTVGGPLKFGGVHAYNRGVGAHRQNGEHAPKQSVDLPKQSVDLPKQRVGLPVPIPIGG